MCQNWDIIWPIGQIMAKFCHTACTPWYTPGKTCIPNKNMNRYWNEDIQVSGNMKLNLLMQTILFLKNVEKLLVSWQTFSNDNSKKCHCTEVKGKLISLHKTIFSHNCHPQHVITYMGRKHHHLIKTLGHVGKNGHRWYFQVNFPLWNSTFKCISFNDKISISIRMTLKLIPEGLINNSSAMVQVMAWCHAGDNPLPEPMLTKIYDAIWHN